MKKALSLCLVFVLCLSLVACALSGKDLIGTWLGSWEYNGNSYTVAFSLEKDGSYAYVMYKNGAYFKEEFGTYIIEGEEVQLHPNGENVWTAYQYKRGKLINNKHEFIKQ